MQQPTARQKKIISILTGLSGAFIAVAIIIYSWLANLFYVMGPPPGQAAHAAYDGDVLVARIVFYVFLLVAAAIAMLPVKDAVPPPPVASDRSVAYTF